MAAARNHGVHHASGSHVLFLDADDELHPSSIEAVLDAVADVSPLLCFGDHVHVSEDGSTTLSVRKKHQYARLWREHRSTVFNPFLHSTFLVHPQIIDREAFLGVGGLREDLGYGDEVELHIRVADEAAVNPDLAPTPA